VEILERERVTQALLLVRAQPDIIQGVEPFSIALQPYLWSCWLAARRTRARNATYVKVAAMKIRARDLSATRIDRVEFHSVGGSVRGLYYHAGGDRASTCIVLCHGYSAGKHNVDPLAFYLAVEGWSSLAFDFLGHKLGASVGRLQTAHDLVQNALDAVDCARGLAGGLNGGVRGRGERDGIQIGGFDEQQHQPADEGVVERHQDCRRGSHHPSKESSSCRVRIFAKPALQPVSESERTLNHALVSIQLNYVAHSFEDRTAALASAKVLVHGSAPSGMYFAVEII